MIYLQEQQRYMLKGDLHVHTEFSDGDILDEVLFQAVNSGFDFFTVSDHDSSKGVPLAQAWLKRKGLPSIVIPGCEVTGPGCHLLALGCDDDIMCSDSIENIAEEVHRKNGFLCAAHPCWSRTRKTFWDNNLFHNSAEQGLFDGIELINYSANKDEDGNVDQGNVPVIEYYKKLQDEGIIIPVTVGSDAHKAAEIGHVYMIAFPEECTADSVLKAIFKDNMAVACWKGEAYGPPDAVALYHKYRDLFAEREIFLDTIHCSLERQENEKDIIFKVGNNNRLNKIYYDRELELVKSEPSAYTLKRNSVAAGRDAVFIEFQTDKFNVLKGVITKTESRVSTNSSPCLKDGQIIYRVKAENNYSKAMRNAKMILEMNGQTTEIIRDILAGECVEYDIPAENILLYGKKNELKITLLDESGMLIDQNELNVMLHAVTDNDEGCLQLEDYVLKDQKRDDDVEAKINFSYDDDELTVTTIVKDNYYHQPYTGNMTYIGDSIQLGLDPQCIRAMFNMKAKQTFEYQLAMTPNGTEATPNMLPPGVDSSPSLDVAAEGNQYTYTFKIKWQELDVKPIPGTILGFNLIVNINDGGGRRGWLQWTSGIADGKRAADWGWLILN